MALVHHNKVEEFTAELLVDVLYFLCAGHSLVERHIDLIGLVDRPIGDLGHRGAKRLEIVDERLVSEDVAVDEEKDSLGLACLPQAPDDLEGRVGLPGAGGHNEQNAILAFGDCLDGAVHCDRLIVAGWLGGAVRVVLLRDELLLPGIEPLPLAVPTPQFIWSRELINSQIALYDFPRPGRLVMEDEPITV